MIEVTNAWELRAHDLPTLQENNKEQKRKIHSHTFQNNFKNFKNNISQN